jgi:hypothetical protein
MQDQGGCLGRVQQLFVELALTLLSIFPQQIAYQEHRKNDHRKNLTNDHALGQTGDKKVHACSIKR